MKLNEENDAKRPYVLTPGACRDAACPVLHADPWNPIHPPDYVPTGPLLPDSNEEADQ